MKSPEQILALLSFRRDHPDEKWRREAVIVKRLFEGDIWQPMTERFGENEHAVVANLALQNLEQMVKRIVSTQPNIKFQALSPGQSTSEKRARTRRLAALGFWEQNRISLQDRERVRWLQGYGVGPVQIGPHPDLEIPKWTLRDPLSTYPAPCDYQTDYSPRDCIFAYKRTYGWLGEYYPETAFQVRLQKEKSNKPCNPDTMFEVVEYVDAEERVVILANKDTVGGSSVDLSSTDFNAAIELERAENRIGICPVVAPRLITAGRLKSPYYDNLGMEIMRNKLAALEYLFAEKSVFADPYFVEPPNSPNGEIVQVADGAKGQIGHLRGGDLKYINMQPNFAGSQMSSRLQDEERTQNSTPSEWSAQGPSNARTARAQNFISGAATDYTIQETQEILQASKQQELRLAIKVDKTYFNRPKGFYVGWQGMKTEKVDYTPSEVWETDRCQVIYSSTGQDLNSFVISAGQRVAQNTMSRFTFMGLDPLVTDVEFESDAIMAEQLRQSILAELLQPGSLDVVAKARVAELVASNKMELPAAIAKVQQERQEAQATSGEPGTPTGPVDPASPEAQAGIAPGAESGIAATPGQEDLASVLGNLRRPQMALSGGA